MVINMQQVKLNKRMKIIITGSFLLFNIFCPALFAQQLLPSPVGDWAKPSIINQQRVDLRQLGYPNVNEIPEYNSAITSLITAGNGMIYGGTTGEEAYLFLFNPANNKVHHLGKIPGQESIHHALVEDSLGNIYIGTSKNMFNAIELSPGEYWDQIANNLWNDITAYFKGYPGGHLYRYNPRKSNDYVKLPDMKAEVEDLGIPVPQNSIYALTISPNGSTIYGITYPDAKFFLYHINEQRFEVIGSIDEKIVFHGPERYWRSISRDLICDAQGRVYFSGTDGMLKYYCPDTKNFRSTDLRIPGDYYPDQFYDGYTVIECFTRGPSGELYGGTSDGYLFVFHPRKNELQNLGKPRADRRLRCLTVGNDGKVYLIAGEGTATSSMPCKLYVYDPNNPGFTDYGMIIVDRSPFYYRRGYQFDSMTTGKDGTIFLGESEYRSSLFILLPSLQE
jgi:hypothetical protein